MLPTPGDCLPKLSVDIPSEKDIAAVLYDDEIYDRCSDDHCPPKSRFPIPKLYYLGGYLDGEIAALYTLHPFEDGHRMHFMVLKAHREHARWFIGAFLGRSPRPLYVVIPSLYSSVVNFAKKVGFSEDGIQANDYQKNGKMYDNHFMRLTWA